MHCSQRYIEIWFIPWINIAFEEILDKKSQGELYVFGQKERQPSNTDCTVADKKSYPKISDKQHDQRNIN